MLRFLSWYTPNPDRLPASRGPFEVQSILFPRSAFTEGEARAWLDKHGYRHVKVDAGEKTLRYRQAPPGRFLKKSFRTIAFGDSGIKAVVGVRSGSR